MTRLLTPERDCRSSIVREIESNVETSSESWRLLLELIVQSRNQGESEGNRGRKIDGHVSPI